MDAGIATEANITWLSAQGYRYIVVSRERQRQFDAERAVPVTTAAGDTVHRQTVLDEAALLPFRDAWRKRTGDDPTV